MPAVSGAANPHNEMSRIIAVANQKGGVGKTWFAVTLASALAENNGRALLFDGDLGLANVDIQLGLVPKRDLGGVIAGRYSLADAVTRYDEGSFDILLADVSMPGMDGIALLQALKKKGSDAEVVMLTGHGTVGDAVDAMRAGAYDYLLKPLKPRAVEAVLTKAAEVRRLRIENRSLRRTVRFERGETRLVGESPPMQSLMKLIEQLAAADGTVMVQGETGTGKELVANATHD